MGSGGESLVCHMASFDFRLFEFGLVLDHAVESELFGLISVECHQRRRCNMRLSCFLYLVWLTGHELWPPTAVSSPRYIPYDLQNVKCKHLIGCLMDVLRFPTLLAHILVFFAFL